MPSRAQMFMDHLAKISGEDAEAPSVFPVKDVSAIVYGDKPEKDMYTSFTWGLSEQDNPLWTAAKPELVISVNTDDLAWAMAVAMLAEHNNGKHVFRYGETINYGGPIAEDSQMDSFVVFAPAALAHDAFTNIDVGDGLPISMVGLYPIHSVEAEFINAHGLDEFWLKTWDMYDVTRKPAV